METTVTYSDLMTAAIIQGNTAAQILKDMDTLKKLKEIALKNKARKELEELL